MTRKKVLSIYALSLPLLVLFFTNMGGRIPSQMLEPQEPPFTPFTIADEIQDLLKKVENGEYGEKGAKIMRVHIRVLSNFLAKEIRAKHCQELQNYVTDLPTDTYLLWNQKDGEQVFCRSPKNLVKALHKAFLKSPGSNEQIDDGVNLYRQKGLIETVFKIANSPEAKNINQNQVATVQATFRSILSREPGSPEVEQTWTEILQEKGLKRFITQLALSLESQQYNRALIGKIQGKTEKLKVRGGRLQFRGWACQEHIDTPIEIEIYAGGKRRSKELIARTVANQSRHDVDSVCKTGVNHSFNFRPRISGLRSLSREPIEVYGVNPVTGESFRIDSNRSHLNVPDFRDDDDD